MDSLLKTYLAERDVPCPGCGYNLHGLGEQSCPECGQRFRLALQVEGWRFKGFVAGVIGASCGFGFWMFFVGLEAIEEVVHGRQGLRAQDRPVAILVAIAIAVHGLMLLMLLSRRRTIVRFLARARIAVVITCWMLPIASIIALWLIGDATR